jgi:hypothetical protein
MSWKKSSFSFTIRVPAYFSPNWLWDKYCLLSTCVVKNLTLPKRGLPLPLVPEKYSQISWNCTLNRSVFVVLGPLGHTGESKKFYLRWIWPHSMVLKWRLITPKDKTMWQGMSFGLCPESLDIRDWNQPCVQFITSTYWNSHRNSGHWGSGGLLKLTMLCILWQINARIVTLYRLHRRGQCCFTSTTSADSAFCLGQ